MTASVAPTGATATYQWKRTSSGTTTNISGATLSTYTLVSADSGCTITVTATGTGNYAGSVTSTATSAVAAS